MATSPIKIALHPHTPEQQTRSFDEPVIIIGRDPNICQIAFDFDRYPMVSRHHAELQQQNSGLVLIDCESSYGTYVNGERIDKPTTVEVGALLQLGASGPIIKVLAIEAEDEVTLQAAVAAEVHRLTVGSGQPAATAPLSSKSPAASIELLGDANHKQQIFALTKDTIQIGRDKDSDIRMNADVTVVSKRHAMLTRKDGLHFITDLASFNGTLVNGKRISTPTELHDDDRIQLGTNGPTLVLHDPSHPVPVPLAPVKIDANILSTMYVGQASASTPSLAEVTSSQILLNRPFQGSQSLTVGRAQTCDVTLDGLQISNAHARLSLAGGDVTLEDLNSTNGVYLNGERVTTKVAVRPQDIIQIGPFVLTADAQQGVTAFDTRAKTRIDAVGVTKVVRNNSGGGTIKLLDAVDLVIQPNEFVGLLGPSGAGKSTLMDSLNGMRPATSGQVLINNLDLYQHLGSLKQSIGYVPQDDIIHRELTVYRTLYYVAKLRLSSDVTDAEIERLVAEVMEVTGLTERRDVPVAQLSGGQRKRVSIAVELVTKPSIIFLDEPTSGLDPATEEKIMRLFRQIAESGRTVVLTTHAMENVKLFDKIVVMMRGKLVFYGAPHEAIAHVGAESFKDLYDKLEAPVTERIGELPPLTSTATPEQKIAHKQFREQITEQVAEGWKQKFLRTSQYEQNIRHPMSAIGQAGRPPAATATTSKRRATVTDHARQWVTLARRYVEVIAHDRLNLLILFGQAPLIALLTYLVVGAKQPRDFPYFMLALVAIWFGTSVAAREIIKERPVYNRERMVNLGLLPYVGSKMLVLSSIVGVQCILLYGTFRLLHFTGLMFLPGETLPQLFVMLLTGMVGIALGLFVSALVKTSEMATSLVPLILIPQILFSGLVGVPAGASKVVGAIMPATWSFDALKRYSTLDTLREEGSKVDGENRGRGLYKQTEETNDRNIAQAQQRIADYEREAKEKNTEFEGDLDEYLKKIRTGQPATPPRAPELGVAPLVPQAVKVGDDLKNYVDFLHPWGSEWLNLLVLLAMFFAFTAAATVALRAQDVG